jgi:ABC-type sugar transport system ATPase subunit
MIKTEGLAYTVNGFSLQGIDLALERGEHFVLLGPPGSGKSLFLECLCGLRRVDSGRITINGRDVTLLEPRRRGIGYVPQDYAILPHLSVAGNIGFGLRAHGFGRGEVRGKTAAIAKKLGIDHLLDRSVAGLSGGERQRTALARALVLEPDVLLLDEPVSALDEATRQEICAEIRGVQRAFGVATIHVSHNLEEAFSVADRAGVMHDGAFQQVGAIGDLLRRPHSEFVARFMRSGNIVRGDAVGEARSAASTLVAVGGGVELEVPGRHGGPVKFVVRPESVRLVPGNAAGNPSTNRLPVTIARSVDCGNYMRVELDGPIALVAHLSHATFAELATADSRESGQELTAVLQPEDIHVIED